MMKNLNQKTFSITIENKNTKAVNVILGPSLKPSRNNKPYEILHKCLKIDEMSIYFEPIVIYLN